MSDLRYDPVFDVWTAISEIRRERPIEFVPIEQSFKQLICPFCSGNEQETPPTILALDQAAQTITGDSEKSWLARVIPNKYPTYVAGVEAISEQIGPFRRSTQPGDQELVIPTPRHLYSLSELTPCEFATGLRAAQLRLAEKETQREMAHAMLFVNCRYDAGASIAHIHFQMIGSPVTTSALEGRAKRFLTTGSPKNSLVAEILEFEQEQRVRLVRETKDFLMVCPFASRMAFQVWIVPRDSAKPFWEISEEQREQVAELSQYYVDRIERLLGKPAYNWMLHQLPFAHRATDHWLIEIVPRVSKTAGYEMGTDIWVNPVAPETAARQLRV
jgi:UDPglucose--hexose-1-phosphate uridylyltransferase